MLLTVFKVVYMYCMFVGDGACNIYTMGETTDCRCVQR